MQSSGFINYNGQIVAQDAKVFGTTNRAYRYGDGLFETMRMMEGNLMFFKYHVERLFRGMDVLKLKYHKETWTLDIRYSSVHHFSRSRSSMDRIEVS